jgi:probable DNA metabolism protein
MNTSAPIFLYDKSFDGFLCCLFQSYARSIWPSAIVGTGEQIPGIWQQLVHIGTDEVQAERVWNGLREKITEKLADELFRIHFSEMENINIPLFGYMRKIFDKGPGIIANYADPDIKAVLDIQHRLTREACRVAQFVRFQKTADNIYFAAYNPDYNVIPMVLHHFEDRFADQRWMIYDIRRKRGYFFDGKEIQWVSLVSEKLDEKTGDLDPGILSDDELLFQDLWIQYFKSICIGERLNLKLHMQKIPKRYWPLLTEKKDRTGKIHKKNTDL